MSNIAPKLDGVRLITGEARLSFPHLFEPHAFNNDQEPKYSASLIIPKTDTATIKLIEQAISEALKQGAAKFGGKIPNKAALRLPLRDGDVDRADDPAYANSYFINANSKTQPGVVDQNVQPVVDENQVYPGCYVRASLTFFAYNSGGGRGVSAGLNHVQKIRDGEPLGGERVSAFDTFDIVDNAGSGMDDFDPFA